MANRNGYLFGGRKSDIHTAAVVVPVWDLVDMSIWERILYVEYCTWAGYSDKNGIAFSERVLSEKFSTIIGNKKGKRISRDSIRKARSGLEEKGVIEIVKAKNNRRIVYLTDDEICRKKGWYRTRTEKERGALLKISE